MPYLWVSLGGIVGANARFVIARMAAFLLGIGFPYGTFFINISGSFLLGLLNTLITHRVTSYPDQLRLLIAVGFLGSYTTFSTLEFESHQLLDDGEWLLGFANLFLSLIAGLLAVRLGIVLGRKWS